MPPPRQPQDQRRALRPPPSPHHGAANDRGDGPRPEPPATLLLRPDGRAPLLSAREGIRPTCSPAPHRPARLSAMSAAARPPMGAAPPAATNAGSAPRCPAAPAGCPPRPRTGPLRNVIRPSVLAAALRALRSATPLRSASAPLRAPLCSYGRLNVLRGPSGVAGGAALRRLGLWAPGVSPCPLSSLWSVLARSRRRPRRLSPPSRVRFSPRVGVSPLAALAGRTPSPSLPPAGRARPRVWSSSPWAARRGRGSGRGSSPRPSVAPSSLARWFAGGRAACRPCRWSRAWPAGPWRWCPSSPPLVRVRGLSPSSPLAARRGRPCPFGLLSPLACRRWRSPSGCRSRRCRRWGAGRGFPAVVAGFGRPPGGGSPPPPAAPPPPPPTKRRRRRTRAAAAVDPRLQLELYRFTFVAAPTGPDLPSPAPVFSTLGLA